MPLKIIRQDITRMEVDAIVNPTNEELYPTGGTDAAIHRAAGPELLRACRAIGSLSCGRAVITPGFGLPCPYVIHTVGPVWSGGDSGERDLLASCYRNCLRLAEENGCAEVAFPLISSGLYGYPKDRVLRVALEVIGEFLLTHEMTVYIVVFDKSSYRISERLFSDITAFIDDRYAEAHNGDYADISERRCASMSVASQRPLRRPRRSMPRFEVAKESFASEASCDRDGLISGEEAPRSAPPTLDEMIRAMDDTFAVALLKLIDLKGMDDVACYKKANVSKQTWYKIQNEKNYRPGKTTVLSFAIALELTLAETEALLATAGYALSRSSKFDVIIAYFLINGNYDIYEIDQTLFQFDQPTLGALA